MSSHDMNLADLVTYDVMVAHPLGWAMPIYDATSMKDMQVLNKDDELQVPTRRGDRPVRGLKMDEDDVDAVLMSDAVIVALAPLTPERFHKLMSALQDGIAAGSRALVVQRHDKIGLLLYKLESEYEPA
jgi:hypothetical protein